MLKFKRRTKQVSILNSAENMTLYLKIDAAQRFELYSSMGVEVRYRSNAVIQNNEGHCCYALIPRTDEK